MGDPGLSNLCKVMAASSRRDYLEAGIVFKASKGYETRLCGVEQTRLLQHGWHWNCRNVWHELGLQSLKSSWLGHGAVWCQTQPPCHNVSSELIAPGHGFLLT